MGNAEANGTVRKEVAGNDTQRSAGGTETWGDVGPESGLRRKMMYGEGSAYAWESGGLPASRPNHLGMSTYLSF